MKTLLIVGVVGLLVWYLYASQALPGQPQPSNVPTPDPNAPVWHGSPPTVGQKWKATPPASPLATLAQPGTSSTGGGGLLKVTHGARTFWSS